MDKKVRIDLFKRRVKQNVTNLKERDYRKSIYDELDFIHQEVEEILSKDDTVVMDSISIINTESELNLKKDGLYFAKEAGTYNISIPSVSEGVTSNGGKTTVASGFFVSFNKKDGKWSLNTSVKLPQYSLPTMTSSIKGGAKVGTTMEVENEVLNVSKSLAKKDVNLIVDDFTIKGSYYNTVGAILSDSIWERTPLMRCNPKMSFISKTSVTRNDRHMVLFFDKDEKFIGGGATFSTVDQESIAPANTYYVAFNNLVAFTSYRAIVDGKFWALQKDNPTIIYTHSGNKEVVVSEIDYTTNTFTSNNHGLTNGNEIGFSISPDCDVLLNTPFDKGWDVTNTTAGFFVVNATANTFQLSLNSNGTNLLTLVQRAGNNFSKWKFEECKLLVVTLSSLNIKKARITMNGGFLGIERYINVLPNIIYTGYKNGVKSSTAISNGYSLFGKTIIDIDIVNGCDIITHNRKTTVLENNTVKQNTEDYLLKTDRTTPLLIGEGVTLSRLKPFNGTVITLEKIY